MPLIPATFTVEFTSQYTGNHRICWRLSTDPPGVYDCTTIVYCTNGNTCNYVFNVQVDNETCDTISYEGYVQPTCFSEASLDGRVPFSSDFIPNPACKTWDITCNDGEIAAILVQNGGGGYTASFPVTIVGDGVGATATANVSGGIVTSITITNPGSGYTTATADLSAGDGFGATATVEIQGCNVSLQDCTGVQPTIVEIPVTETLKVCGEIQQLVPAEATIVQNGHCICQDCTGYVVNNPTGSPVDVYYLDCNTQLLVTETVPAAVADYSLAGGGCDIIPGSAFASELDSTDIIELPCV